MMLPDVGSSNPAINFARDVLPPPFGPVITTSFPDGISKFIFLIILYNY